jgi:hypothetical protein
MAEYGLGLLKLELATIAGDGGPGTAFTEVGNTVQGTAQLTEADGTTTDFNIEETDEPVESITTKGKKTLAFSCYDMSGPNLVKFFGGTYVPYNVTGPVHESYTPPATTVTIEKTVRLTDKKGNILQINRGSITAKFNWSFTKDQLAKIDVTIAVLTPTKDGVAPMTITYPDPA